MVAREYDLTVAQLFQSHKAYYEGSSSAIGASETVVTATTPRVLEADQESLRRLWKQDFGERDSREGCVPC
jgi:hypothetical protein